MLQTYKEQTIALSFADVMIEPQPSDIISRNLVGLTTKFDTNQGSFSCTPIIAANMTTIGTIKMAKELSDYGMMTALHKYYDEHRLLNYIIYNTKAIENTWFTIGPNCKSLSKQLRPIDFAKKVCASPIKICIDAANGYLSSLHEFIKDVRSEMPDSIIMAGNVVTKNGALLLLEAGVDIIKCGIGEGCFVAGTRILMANGKYKNIQEVKAGDKVINKDGDVATVKRAFSTGLRKVRRYRHVHSIDDTFATPDHKHYVGDLNTSSRATLQSKGYVGLLVQESKTTPKQSKIKWKQLQNLEQDVFLLPSNIKFNIQETFEIELSKYCKKSNNRSYNIKLTPNYDLGYIIGTFLGDGCSNINYNHNRKSFSGRCDWYFGLNENDIAIKLAKAIKSTLNIDVKIKKTKSIIKVTLYCKPIAHLLDECGKKENKFLPNKLWCGNKQYQKGLWDGLIDSDGYIGTDERISFSNTSTRLIELFSVLTYLIKGNFPNIQKRKPTAGGLNCNVENCKTSYTARLNKSHTKRNLENQNLAIVKPLEFGGGLEEIVAQTYDLEIEDENNTHSFIANNVIVHNSVCSTRIKTGVGCPQITAIENCCEAIDEYGYGFVCSDGGCTRPGDIAKAYVAGADLVMIGGMLAGHKECGGKIKKYHRLNPFRKTARTMKFYGMSSDYAQGKHGGGPSDYRASEGHVLEVPYRGTLKESGVIRDILGGLRSACTYVGARNLNELYEKGRLIRTTMQENRWLY